MKSTDDQAQQEKTLTALKNSSLEMQTQLATTASEKKQLELRMQAKETSLAEAQQVAQQRVAESSADKGSRAKAQDELNTVKASYQKLKERHEALTSAANAQGGSAADVAIREERTKLLVSTGRGMQFRASMRSDVQWPVHCTAKSTLVG